MPNSENNHYVKFYRGSANAWDLLLHSQTGPDDDTLYFVYDSNVNKNEGKLYLGDRLIGTVGDSYSDISIDNIEEIDIDGESLSDKLILVYNDIEEKWQNVSISELKDIIIQAIDDFVGATANLPGSSGLVPAPSAGELNSFLMGNGNWANFDSNVFTVVSPNTLTLLGISLAPVGTIPMKTLNGIQWSSVGVGTVTREITTLAELEDNIEAGLTNENTIYMVPNSSTGTDNAYDEYFVINGELELIGTIGDVDLSNYVTSSVFINAIGNLNTILNGSGNNPGLISRVTFLEGKIGDLNLLILSSDNTTLVDEINTINQRLQWQEINNE